MLVLLFFYVLKQVPIYLSCFGKCWKAVFFFWLEIGFFFISVFFPPVRRCPVLPAPLYGYLTCSSDGNNYGATCDYHCDGGYELKGVSSRVCTFNRNWEGTPAECVRKSSRMSLRKFCASKMLYVLYVGVNAGLWFWVFVAMEIKSDVKTVSALLDQFYEKRRLLIMSAPNISDSDYQLQNIMIQVRTLSFAAVNHPEMKIQSSYTHRHAPWGWVHDGWIFIFRWTVPLINNMNPKMCLPCSNQKADCGLDLRHVTLIELLGSPPRETGRIKESLLNSEVIEGLR